MWNLIDNNLQRSFEFKDFIEAFSFMTSVAIIAEKKNHHPTWTNSWNKVIIKLSTHEAGDIVTEKDYDLAFAIDELYNRN